MHELTTIQPQEMALRPFDPERLIATAIEKGTDVNVMERLLAMRKDLKAEAAKEAFDLALASFQGECPTIEKTKAVTVDGSVRYKYAPLDSIVEQTKPYIQRHGFSYSMDTEPIEKGVRTLCKITHKDGHSQVSRFEVPIEQAVSARTGKQLMSAPQQYACALTFSKRYAFCNAFGILTGDEDTDGKLKRDKPAGPSNMEPEKPEAKTVLSQLWELLKNVRGAKNNWDAANAWLREKTLIGDEETCQRMNPKRMAKLIEDVKKIL